MKAELDREYAAQEMPDDRWSDIGFQGYTLWFMERVIY